MAICRKCVCPRLRMLRPYPRQHARSIGRAPMSTGDVQAITPAPPPCRTHARMPARCCARARRALMDAFCNWTRSDQHAHAPACLPARSTARITMALCVRARTRADDTHVIAALSIHMVPCARATVTGHPVLAISQAQQETCRVYARGGAQGLCELRQHTHRNPQDARAIGVQESVHAVREAYGWSPFLRVHELTGVRSAFV